jgi:hypothetical protein
VFTTTVGTKMDAANVPRGLPKGAAPGPRARPHNQVGPELGVTRVKLVLTWCSECGPKWT